MTPTSKATSPYLNRGLRTEEEARRDIGATRPCYLCDGLGYIICEREFSAPRFHREPCPICNPSREEDNG